eukprot:gnl/MRDRNA2_/MRDRNA2_132495_c0_seq1.p1 gnl/MRDRNA2_/MRDRNA2_132495_c0~~gnl/MRDRNA2_/MRDRNA2_132495_c0_seq1.p1  ORF type:complete len:403 (-),score=77.59 gnl/MRDRNA2_/MRDRNA2_132495_c0_seq1:56-1264(-)
MIASQQRTSSLVLYILWIMTASSWCTQARSVANDRKVISAVDGNVEKKTNQHAQDDHETLLGSADDKVTLKVNADGSISASEGAGLKKIEHEPGCKTENSVPFAVDDIGAIQDDMKKSKRADKSAPVSTALIVEGTFTGQPDCSTQVAHHSRCNMWGTGCVCDPGCKTDQCLTDEQYMDYGKFLLKCFTFFNDDGSTYGQCLKKTDENTIQWGEICEPKRDQCMAGTTCQAPWCEHGECSFQCLKKTESLKYPKRCKANEECKSGDCSLESLSTQQCEGLKDGSKCAVKLSKYMEKWDPVNKLGKALAKQLTKYDNVGGAIFVDFCEKNEDSKKNKGQKCTRDDECKDGLECEVFVAKRANTNRWSYKKLSFQDKGKWQIRKDEKTWEEEHTKYQQRCAPEQ